MATGYPSFGAGGGGQGFVLGPANNLFGATAGDASASPLPVSAATNRTAAESTRDTYFTANPSNLASYTANSTLGIYIYFTAGSTTTIIGQQRVGGSWVDSSSVNAVQGRDGMGALDASIPDNTIILKTTVAGQPAARASSFVEQTAMVESTKPVMSTGFQSNSVMLVGAGESITSQVASGDLYRAIGARYTKANGTERPGFVDTGAQSTPTIQSDDTQTLSGNSLQFIFASTASGIATAYTFRSRLTTGIDNCNFISRFNSHTGDNIAFDYQRDNGGVGFRIPAQSETADPTTGEFTVTLPVSDGAENGVEFREDVPTYVTIQAPAGETIQLAGGPLTQSGIPVQQVPYIVVTGNTGPIRGLLHQGDIDDTSTTTALLTAAQIDTRITNATPNTESIQDIVGGMVSGNTETGIDVTYNDTTGKLNFVVGTFNAPTIDSFSIQNQATTVDGGTAISGSQTFLYSVTNSSSITGTGTLRQGSTVLSTTVSPTGTSLAQTVNAVNLAAGESVTWTLEFTTTMGGTVSRTFTVRARQQAEILYYGIMATNIAATVDVSTLTIQDVFAGTQFNADFVIPNTQYAVILSPADRDITEILERTFSEQILSDFTKTENARTISGQMYDAYVHQNSGGVQGTLATRITVS